MLIIPIKDGENIDRALKRFKRKFDKTGGMRQLRSRKQSPKSSKMTKGFGFSSIFLFAFAMFNNSS